MWSQFRSPLPHGDPTFMHCPRSAHQNSNMNAHHLDPTTANGDSIGREGGVTRSKNIWSVLVGHLMRSRRQTGYAQHPSTLNPCQSNATSTCLHVMEMGNKKRSHAWHGTLFSRAHLRLLRLGHEASRKEADQRHECVTKRNIPWPVAAGNQQVERTSSYTLPAKNLSNSNRKQSA